MPIDHVKLTVSDLATSRRVYTAALAPLGWRLVFDGERSVGLGTGDGGGDDEPLAVGPHMARPVRQLRWST